MYAVRVCYVVSCQVTSCSVALLHVIPCDVISRRSMIDHKLNSTNYTTNKTNLVLFIDDFLQYSKP
jgi:hypothetical protein